MAKPTEWNRFVARYTKGAKSRQGAMAAMREAARAWNASGKGRQSKRSRPTRSNPLKLTELLVAGAIIYAGYWFLKRKGSP